MPYLRWLVLSTLIAGLSCSLYAVDGVVLIDQNRALAGGVTPGDTPGFPVTLSLPGSYRLAGDLTVPDANTNGIVINADHVTIDLNGFSIIGPTNCTGAPVTSCSPTGTGFGVSSSSAGFITVKNGGVRGMGSIGLFLNESGNLVDQVIAENNGTIGIYVNSGSVLNSVATFNLTAGIFVVMGTVRSNTSQYNGAFGIRVSCPSLVVNNDATNNQTQNVSAVGTGCTVVNNAAP
ncbi:MAG TPA: hypothetical protein VKG25_08785 [Bryobacteraceae bacterium]|nr:hypothetical protein [Bryobacteraceae bacterium]